MATKSIFSEIINRPDQYEVAKAQLDLNITRFHLNRYLATLLVRVLGEDDDR